MVVSAASVPTEEGAMDTKPTMIAVGVDSSPEALAAARFGVETAELYGLDLLLCHAVCPPATTASSAWLLDRVQSRLRIPPTMVVRTRRDQLAPAVLLKELEDDAAMVVVGHRRVDRPEHSILGSLAAQLVASVRRPLAVVPAGWESTPWTSRPVVVALDVTTDADEVLTFACPEAARLQAALVVTHVVAPADLDEANLSLRAVHELLAGWKQDYPDLTFNVDLLVGEPDRAIIETSRRARLLVVGGPRHPRRRFGWTDSVARTGVRWAHCPIVVVPRS
jgi:nucleotide-binding universal stress UspA family protein